MNTIFFISPVFNATSEKYVKIKVIYLFNIRKVSKIANEFLGCPKNEKYALEKCCINLTSRENNYIL